jgi:hypothetical protein
VLLHAGHNLIYNVPATCLSANTETCNDTLIALVVLSPQVTEQAATSPHELEQAASRMMILFVGFEVFSKISDTGTQESNLNL